MNNHSPFIITPLPPPGQWQALRAQLGSAVKSILQIDGQQLPQAVHEQLIDKLTEAVMFAKEGSDLSGAAALDQSTLTAVPGAITETPLSTQQSKSLATRLKRAAQTVASKVNGARKQRIQQRRQGAGRPLDVWKNTLMGDVERALREAGVERAYWTTEREQAAKTVLPAIFRACAVAAGQPVPGDLRNVHRGRFRPTALLPFSASRFSIRKLAKAIWQFLPLKP